MGRLEREELRVVLLDTKNHCSVSRSSAGNVSASLVGSASCSRRRSAQRRRDHPVHNHPPGDRRRRLTTPLTAEALAAGRLDIARSTTW
jgi:DNA repair protein RadC